jgi:hypothetical protein
MTEIIVVGFPKSGNTWLSRLLGELCQCPVTGIGSAHPIAEEGLDRDSTNVVRQLHLKPTSIYGDDRPPNVWESAVDNAYWFGTELWDPEETIIIHVIRDPRDIAVSIRHYWQRDSLAEAIEAMVFGHHPLKTHGPWAEYIKRWLPLVDVHWVKFEQLVKDPYKVLTNLCVTANLPNFIACDIAIKRQSFQATKARIAKEGNDMPYGREVQDRNLRKGVAGDWVNHWTMSLGMWVDFYWRDPLFSLGWERDPEWYAKLRRD